MRLPLLLAALSIPFPSAAANARACGVLREDTIAKSIGPANYLWVGYVRPVDNCWLAEEPRLKLEFQFLHAGSNPQVTLWVQLNQTTSTIPATVRCQVRSNVEQGSSRERFACIAKAHLPTRRGPQHLGARPHVDGQPAAAEPLQFDFYPPDS